MYEIVIIVFLLFLNGLLAMSEIAFVSARRFKLEEKAKKGNLSAKKALLLLVEPEKFLSAVQIGITLIGILAGVFGGYAMAEDLIPHIEKIAYLAPYSTEISFFLIVAIITYLSLVIGELVPKSIAMNNPEEITLLMAPMMYLITNVLTPFVSFLSVSTKIVLFLTGVKKNEDPPVTEEELKTLLAIGTMHGTFEKEESEMIKKIFSFNDKRVIEIMVPSTEIEWIEISMSNQEILDFISSHHYSKYIVCENNIDHAIGILEVKEFLLKYVLNHAIDLRTILNEILFVPESIYSIELFELFRTHKTNTALIVDEYGGTLGIITLHDLIENIVGDIPEKYEKLETEIFQRKDKSYLVDGSIELKKLSELLLVEFAAKDFTTLGGFLMMRLGKLPVVGDTVTYSLYKFEVVDMDGKRVDKVLIEKLYSS